MGSRHSQHVSNQKRTWRVPSQAAFNLSPLGSQPLIPVAPSLNMKNVRIQQHGGTPKGRMLLPGSWLAQLPPSEQLATLNGYLPDGVVFTASEASSDPMWNVQGSSDCQCLQFEGEQICSWITVCKVITGKRVGLCSFDGCLNKAKYGGHVKYKNAKTWYLAPICPSCNNTNYDSIATPMKLGTILVKIQCHCPK